MKTKQNQRWVTFLTMLGVVLLGLGFWATTPERVYAEDTPGTSTKALDAIEVEFGTLRQKAMTNELTQEEEKREAWLGGQLMQRFLAASLGRFTLEGVVVDEQGMPLDDVSFRISKEKVVGFDKWEKDTEEQIINRTFSITARGYSDVSLYVNKDGYFEEIVYFSAPDPDDYRNPEEPVVDQRDIRIVLEKRGDITDLIEKDFKLTYRRQQDGSASGHLVDFGRNKWEEYARGRGAKNPIPVANLFDPELTPPMCVYMIPKVDNDGRILTETRELEEWKPYNHKEVFPKELRIVTSDPEGGFIIYDQQPEDHAYWSMKLAPENGYKQEIILNPDWMFRRSGYVASGASKYIFYYFKINGRYGKGRFESLRFPEGDYALEMKTEFRLQNDGSRNLDTGRD